MAMFFKTITIMKLKIFKNKATLLVRNLKSKVLYVITSVFSQKNYNCNKKIKRILRNSTENKQILNY